MMAGGEGRNESGDDCRGEEVTSMDDHPWRDQIASRARQLPT